MLPWKFHLIKELSLYKKKCNPLSFLKSYFILHNKVLGNFKGSFGCLLAKFTAIFCPFVNHYLLVAALTETEHNGVNQSIFVQSLILF